MILKLLKIKNTIKSLKENPSKFAGEEAGGFFLGMILGPILISLLILVLFFIIGFTGLIGGPFGFFKFLFFLLLIPLIIVFLILLKAYKMIRNGIRKTVDDTIKVKSKVIE